MIKKINYIAYLNEYRLVVGVYAKKKWLKILSFGWLVMKDQLKWCSMTKAAPAAKVDVR